MAGVGGAGNMGAGTQIIGGKTYSVYSPEWRAAMDADKVKTAGVEGTAQGTAAGNRLTAETPALEGLFNSINKNSFGASSSSNNGLPGGSNGVPAGPAGVAPVDTSAATSAAFANAKDQVGQETGGALTGLRSALAGRGLLGSGAESRGTTSVITKGQGELGKTSRGQAIETADLGQKNAETNYQGQVEQRGQDIAREQNVMQAQNQQAQLQLQQRQMVLNGLMSALSGSVQIY